MFSKIKNIILLSSFFSFVALVVNYYFSEKNIIMTNKSRSSFVLQLNLEGDNLPILVNDTDNIIVYKNDLEEFNKKRKKRVWEKLITN